jgi:RsmE family RNA methyltransferase
MYFYLPTDSVSRIEEIYTEHFFSMRVKPGDLVYTTDLNGLVREIKIIEAEKKDKLIRFEILKSFFTPQKKQQNILFQAITDKIYLEKMVEIAPHANIDVIYLFHSERSPIGNVNTDRLERILYRSCEQAQKSHKPKIEITDKKSLLEKIDIYRPIVLEIPKDTSNITHPLSTSDTSKSVFVGPEGGWSVDEVSLFVLKQLVFESLGEVVYPAWLAGYTWFSKNSY